MARPKRNTVDYFPHSVYHGKKMNYIEKKYGNDGYAIWFKIIEELGNTDLHYLDLKDEVQIMFLSSRCLVTEELLLSVIEDLVKLHEFDDDLWENHKVLFSQKFVESIKDAYKKRNSNCIDKKSLLLLLRSFRIPKPPKSIPKPPKGILKGDGNTQSRVKETKVKETKVNKTEIYPNFNDFWELYNKKVGNKNKIEKKWEALSQKTKEKIMLYLPNYIKAQPDKKFRKNPETFLNNKSWKDEIVDYANKNQNNQRTDSDLKRAASETVDRLFRKNR